MLTHTTYCRLCHSPLFIAHHGICCYCLKKITHPTKHYCPQCGLKTLHSYLCCGRCLQNPPPWHHLISAGPYSPPYSQLLHQFKYQGKIELCTIIARLMLLAWLSAKRDRLLSTPHYLVSVPLFRLKQWRRGYNQSHLLAKKLAYWLNCHYLSNSLAKTKPTLPQQQLSAKQRKENIKKVFTCYIDFTNLDIILIDDVVTTTSTITEISQLLLAAGVRSIYVLCFCRAL